MKFNTALISIIALATSSLVHAVPIDKRDDSNVSTVSVQQPSFTASASSAHYSAVASITILGPDGHPLTFGGQSTSDASSVGTFIASYVLLPAAITSYILI